MEPNQRPYSQSRALWAITRASFKAIFAYPGAIFFSLMFPIIFVLIFGAFGNGGGPAYRVALEKPFDTTDTLYKSLKAIVKIIEYPDTTQRRKDLIRGRLTAILNLEKSFDSVEEKPHYRIGVRTTTASENTIHGFLPILRLLKLEIENKLNDSYVDYVAIGDLQKEVVRKYRQIDFVLPGQLGFSILFSTLFGIAFTFFGLREQLVLKRLYASPVNRLNILVGIGVSRLFFQLLSVIVLILFGHFALNFTLQHGMITFAEILVMTVVMLFLLMGVGLIFSSIVKSDSAIPLLINLFGFPQMMLSGTFFPIEVFPKWLQEICRVLPLTQYNDSVRKISFEGQHLDSCLKELGIMGIWILITYVILVRVLKWE